MTRWLVTGAGGMLGREVVALRPDATALTRADLDITDRSAVVRAVAGHEVVVNCAAWTQVDAAEAHEAEATKINGDAVSTLAGACADAGAVLLHVSTDYVFDGRGTSPYAEDAPTDPVNAYGRSKLVGERAVLATPRGYVVRTAWLYGAHGKNFVATMLRLAGERDTVSVVADQVGQPTWARALAAQLVELGTRAAAGTAPPGVYHGTASGTASWFDLARAVFATVGLDPERVHPITSDRYPLPAPRPSYSVLGHDGWARAGMPPQPDWQTQLKEALATGGLG
ncbi:dTDP-4-dehydrorhamnose reductase [Virgisporangium ochraceum]|uniref:dTDP-4-dehydrorhamnose reductase n=1 Tax=Virgisporangium ochraceum TaxID=65505 RepID=A0A8J4A2N3_9ACTN|nr:dTDP-4-dehydrorhamnose reductase [Virgisporangium ochraceum]GIJ74717.1 dTDP-4-dehydrorhamnose reductase [Virgisporangium ochraceum]